MHMMKLPRRRQFLHLAAGAVALPTVSRLARAQDYPTRPVTLIVPWPAGGTTDVALRKLATATEKYRARTSAPPQKRTNGPTSWDVRFVPIVLQKSPSGLYEVEICNYRIGAPVLLNRCCAFQPDLESIFLAEMLKILLQHNRHISDIHRCPLYGRFRGQSGQQPAIAEQSRFMSTCPNN